MHPFDFFLFVQPIQDVLKHVEKGYRMEAPEGTPPPISALMADCWQLLPGARPTFKEILGILDGMIRWSYFNFFTPPTPSDPIPSVSKITQKPISTILQSLYVPFPLQFYSILIQILQQILFCTLSRVNLNEWERAIPSSSSSISTLSSLFPQKEDSNRFFFLFSSSFCPPSTSSAAFPPFGTHFWLIVAGPFEQWIRIPLDYLSLQISPLSLFTF